MNLRTLAMRLSRGIVLRRRLPREFLSLPICVSPEMTLRYWGPMAGIDPPLYKIGRELVTPGAVVWDVGANVGLFGFSAAALAGPTGFVLTIEPDLWTANLLTRSARRVEAQSRLASPVAVVCAAVSESNRITQLQIAESGRASNCLAEAGNSNWSNGSRYQQCTLTVSLDFLLEFFPAPSVLKIDVETTELGVLRGASKILREIRPTILCEVAPGNCELVSELLHQNGYQLYAADTEKAERISLRRASVNTLAIPAPGSPGHASSR
jgi:FkbM family methyltransferase